MCHEVLAEFGVSFNPWNVKLNCNTFQNNGNYR